MQKVQQKFAGSSKCYFLIKSYLSLVSSAASWTWWNGLLKYSQRSQYFKGSLEPTLLRYITLGEEGKRGQREIERERSETVSKMENTLKPKCKKEMRWFEKPLEKREKKLKMKDHRAQKQKQKKTNFNSKLILRSDEIRAQWVHSLLAAEFRHFVLNVELKGGPEEEGGRSSMSMPTSF